MTRYEATNIARKLGYNQIHFQFNIAKNTGKEFEVGYVSKDGNKALFCKRQSHTDETQFYLCNEFRGNEFLLEPTV